MHLSDIFTFLQYNPLIYEVLLDVC